MCGIAGVFGSGDTSGVSAMIERLRHRGPDDLFQVAGERFVLAACRLAILDPSGGRQPLSNEDGTIWACQNGEIYTYAALREDLIREGHRLRTHTDTEVLPHLYEKEGESFPTRLAGMFAVALWDDRRGTGVLARDRAGKKPLYYAALGAALYFASEIKALLALPGFDRALEPEAVHHFLSFRHVPQPLTAFRGIRSLPPAHTLSFRQGEPTRLRRYWRLSWAPSERYEKDDPRDIAEDLAATLGASVRRRLVSDVPVGFYLSGGLDSSLSTALAAPRARAPIETFTLVYSGESGSPAKEADRRFAREVARRYGTTHREEEIEAPDLSRDFERILRAFDEPFAGVVSPFFLARRIARHVKVAVAGDGADELFGSYLSHRVAASMDDYLREGDRALEGLADAATIRRVADPDPAVWRARLLLMSEAEKRQLWAPEFLECLRGVAPTEERLAADFSEPTAGDTLNRVLEAEFRGIFPDQVLTFVDRLSMAHSLETRTPYLDTEFMEKAASVPGRYKIRNGVVKWILKESARPFLSAELIDRPKEGFVMPMNDWLRGPLQAFAREVLAGSVVRRAQIVRADVAAEWCARLAAGETALAPRVHALLALHVWWEAYFGDRRAA